MCGRAHPTPLVGKIRKPRVLAWRERKNPRGKPKTICTPIAQVAQVLLVVNVGLTIADTGSLFQHSEVTIRLWLTPAGKHAHKIHARFIRTLALTHFQLDELFTALRDKTLDLRKHRTWRAWFRQG